MIDTLSAFFDKFQAFADLMTTRLLWANFLAMAFFLPITVYLQKNIKEKHKNKEHAGAGVAILLILSYLIITFAAAFLSFAFVNAVPMVVLVLIIFALMIGRYVWVYKSFKNKEKESKNDSKEENHDG